MDQCNSRKSSLKTPLLLILVLTLQTHHVDSTLKQRGNDRFHVVSTWNPRGVFVGYERIGYLNASILWPKYFGQVA